MSALPKSTSQDALRRGWCPSTLKPMETGDGWLVRLHPPGATLTPAQLGRIAGLASEHGNGLLEISARANLQIRGVTPVSHPALVERLLTERLVDEHDGDGPQRLTLVSPLAGVGGYGSVMLGLDPSISETSALSGRRFSGLRFASPENDGGGLIDATSIADTIETQARTIPGLPPKLCVIVDDGGVLSLDAFSCDLRLFGIGDGLAALGLADRRWHGPLPEAETAAAVTSILQAFSGLHRAAPDTIRRLRDLPAEALATLTDLPCVAAPAPSPAPRRAGLFTSAGGRFAVLIGLPFGRCEARTLALLAETAGGDGIDIRLSPWRGLAFRGLSQTGAEQLLALAEELGLIVCDSDPRLSVQACAGSPACSRAEAPTMADAARLAEAAAGLLSQGVTLHVSGCIKSCAHPAAADLTLVGRAGRYDVVLHGTARDKPFATLDLSTLLARLQPGEEIHARLAKTARITGPRG